MSENIIETKGLTKRFGEKISVNRVDLHVPRGEIYGFLGPNGAGKTTTIRMLLGLMQPTEGEISLFGKSLRQHHGEILRRVGALVESPSYYAHLTGYENLKVWAYYLGVEKKRIMEVLEWVRLGQWANEKVGKYSLGMKRRLGIAAALLGSPELLILDEPTNDLDPAGIQEIRTLIKELPQTIGVTVLVSSHLLSEVEQIATYVGIINKGNLIFQDRLTALQEQSHSRMEIETDRLPEAKQLLCRYGWEVDVRGQCLSIACETKAETAAVVEALVLGKHAVYQAAYKKPSLEEMFIKLTGKGQSL